MEPPREPPREPPGSERAAGGLTRAGPRAPQLQNASIAALCAELLARVQRDGEALAAGGDATVLGRLQVQLELVLDSHWNRFSRANNLKCIRQLRAFPGWRDEMVQGATCVELGCGALNPLGNLLTLLALGARSVVGVELEEVEDVPRAVRALYAAAVEMLASPAGYFGPGAPTADFVRSNLARCNLPKLRRGDPAGLTPDARLVRTSAESTGLASGSVDITTSVSFLEHVADPDAVLRELARVTRPGGIGAHRIDGRDHRWYRDPQVHPLAFLREPVVEIPLVYGCNRLRPLEYAAVFERAGFAVLDVAEQRTVDVGEALRGELAEPFKSLPLATLEVVGALFCLRRK